MKKIIELLKEQKNELNEAVEHSIDRNGTHEGCIDFKLVSDVAHNIEEIINNPNLFVNDRLIGVNYLPPINFNCYKRVVFKVSEVKSKCKKKYKEVIKLSTFKRKHGSSKSARKHVEALVKILELKP